MKLKDHVKERALTWANESSIRKAMEADKLSTAILEVLKTNPNAQTPRDLAKVLDVDQFHIERAIQRLRKQGKIELVHYWKVKE